jgi:hypothetical protein
VKDQGGIIKKMSLRGLTGGLRCSLIEERKSREPAQAERMRNLLVDNIQSVGWCLRAYELSTDLIADSESNGNL